MLVIIFGGSGGGIVDDDHVVAAVLIKSNLIMHFSFVHILHGCISQCAQCLGIYVRASAFN